MGKNNTEDLKEIKKRPHYRRLYTYPCIKCHKKRDTVRYGRLVLGVCRVCRRGEVPGQESLFEKVINIFKPKNETKNSGLVNGVAQ
jgi:ribosomal protein S14